MPADSLFSKWKIDPREQVKEFGEGDNLDDSPAFLEDRVGVHELLPPEDVTWRAAKSLLKLRDQLDVEFPGRSKASDGLIGDEAHCPNPDGTGDSDHCPNIPDGGTRVVTAFDATHDPEKDCNMQAIVESIRLSKDSRIKYVIWNKKIYNSKKIGNAEAWKWRPYSGVNPHTRHAHLSVLAEKEKYDDDSAWRIQQEPFVS